MTVLGATMDPPTSESGALAGLHGGLKSTQAVATSGCPVCGGEAQVLALPQDVAARISRALGSSSIPTLIADQELARCANCTLEFADPMVEPGAAFYEWLTRSGFDYPHSRWEWEAATDHLASLASDGVSRTVLDLGSGEGLFLQMAGRIDGIRALGVDHNRDVVQDCVTRGLDVVHGGVREALQRVPEGIDVATLWHVVEHVANPVILLRELRGVLRPGGFIAFSVPVSPLSYEHAWLDPFNLPPHHLTRWNPRSLAALAASVEMRMELELPVADGLVRRALRALVLRATDGAHISPALKLYRLLRFALVHPRIVKSEFEHQRARGSYRGAVLPDLVLVRLFA